jgi:hypothetical protein
MVPNARLIIVAICALVRKALGMIFPLSPLSKPLLTAASNAAVDQFDGMSSKLDARAAPDVIDVIIVAANRLAICFFISQSSNITCSELFEQHSSYLNGKFWIINFTFVGSNSTIVEGIL